MIKISNITKKYNPKKSNEFEALHGVSCEINDGELVAVIGKSEQENLHFCIFLLALTIIRKANILLTELW